MSDAPPKVDWIGLVFAPAVSGLMGVGVKLLESWAEGRHPELDPLPSAPGFDGVRRVQDAADEARDAFDADHPSAPAIDVTTIEARLNALEMHVGLPVVGSER
jgi:hypothetical protein